MAPSSADAAELRIMYVFDLVFSPFLEPKNHKTYFARERTERAQAAQAEKRERKEKRAQSLDAICDVCVNFRDQRHKIRINLRKKLFYVLESWPNRLMFVFDLVFRGSLGPKNQIKNVHHKIQGVLAIFMI